MTANQESNMQKKGTRANVDPTAWESSEVGSAEATAFSPKGKHGKGGNVSSIRSSLFRKHAKGMAQKPAQQMTVDEAAPIFQTPVEAVPLQAPFSFEGNSSLEYCDYGKMNKKKWTKDILALVHNAVRSELNDLTIVLRSIQKLGVQLRIGDFVKIRGWWQDCSGVVLDFLDVEMKHLMPWIKNAVENAKSKDESCTDLFRILPQRQKELRDLVMSTSKAFGDLCDPLAINLAKAKHETSTAKKALLVVNSLDALVSQTSDYMSEQETRLPETLTAVYKSEKKERDPILTTVIKYFGKSARKSEIILVLLTRWMSDSKATKTFTKTLLEIHDCNYSSLQTQFEVNHAGFVHQFSVKAEI